MKTLILSALALFLSITIFCKNRIATEADRELYGEYITAGDLIIDTPTKQDGTGRELIYYFMAKQWPGLREGGTIWLDGEQLGFLNGIKLCNTASPFTPWHISSARIKNIPHTRVRARGLFCQGLKEVEINGESEAFPGLSSWPASRKFLTGSFGFHIINKMFANHGFHIVVLDGGTIKMNGIEAQHGFTAIRINGGDYDMTVEKVEITNFYIHDTGDGEGMYLGATHAPPYAKIRNLKIYNGIITRTAAEALQVQHLAGGADVHHITIRSANVAWMNAFQPGQDTGIQWNIDGGENKLHHVIVDGYASVGLVPFGNPVEKPGGISKVSDILFSDGVDTGIYLHKSGSFGMRWHFDNLYYRSFTSACYYESTGRPERRYIISARIGTDEYTFDNIVHDSSKPAVFQDTTKSRINMGSTSYRALPPVQYQNSGFHEPANKIKQWSQHYAKYFPASKGGKMSIPTDWQEGDIAIDAAEDREYRFYKCITSHTSTEQRPDESAYFTRITWDENGIRSDQPGWNKKMSQSNFPPDDLRVVKDSYWEKLNLGFPER